MPVSCIASPGGLSGHLNDVVSGRLSEAYCILMYALVIIIHLFALMVVGIGFRVYICSMHQSFLPRP